MEIIGTHPTYFQQTNGSFTCVSVFSQTRIILTSLAVWGLRIGVHHPRSTCVTTVTQTFVSKHTLLFRSCYDWSDAQLNFDVNLETYDSSTIRVKLRTVWSYAPKCLVLLSDRRTLSRPLRLLRVTRTLPQCYTVPAQKPGGKEMFYLTTHSTHFIYGYMASDIWLRTILIVRKETRCRHIGYSFRLAARVLLYVPSHRQDSTYHGLC